MKQGMAKTSIVGSTKQEPNSKAVNPAYAAELGVDESRFTSIPMYEGRGLEAPMTELAITNVALKENINMADINTDKIDFGRCAMLLDVVHKCATVGPRLTSLGNAAMTELTKLNETIATASREAELERQRVEAEAQAEAQAKAQAEAAAKEEEQRKTIPPRAFPATNTEIIGDQNIDRRI